MKKLFLMIVAIMASMMLVACGSGSTTDSAGDNYNVSVNNVGDGDVTVNTGSGTVTINNDGECFFVTDDNSTRPCTEDEILNASTKVENALYRL